MKAPSEQLIAAACAGDAAAISQLLAICQPDIKRFAQRTCANKADADDAAQMALWQLYRKIGTLKTAAAFTSWLFRIVERSCHRLFRKRQSTLFFNEVGSSNANTLQKHVELQKDLAFAIAALPENYRTVLILRDVDELTTPEVATKLAITTRAVKSRLHRARKLVRHMLTANGY
ncbi:RNA polymerase sigma factor [Kalamiella sp. sgz302252]|uniref:RNA polymerase sigma factor n=1 Tax=Pantoea sp. sgz302252 TaxID=3341827 RepID=UPI0036D3AAA1